MKKTTSTTSTTNVTFSLPIDLVKKLKISIDRGKMSTYVADLIAEDLKKKREVFKSEYRAAAQDKNRIKGMEDWKVLDMEGLDNEEW